jgi:hypothetical protein
VAELYQLRTLACTQARVTLQEGTARHNANTTTRLASFDADHWCFDGAASVCHFQRDCALCNHWLGLHLLTFASGSI